jgi:hypothetical protein
VLFYGNVKGFFRKLFMILQECAERQGMVNRYSPSVGMAERFSPKILDARMNTCYNVQGKREHENKRIKTIAEKGGVLSAIRGWKP